MRNSFASSGPEDSCSSEADHYVEGDGSVIQPRPSPPNKAVILKVSDGSHGNTSTGIAKPDRAIGPGIVAFSSARPVALISEQDLTDLFPEADEDMSWFDQILLFLLLFMLTFSSYAVFSGMFTISFRVYSLLMSLEPIWLGLMVASVFAMVVLHAANWYQWSFRRKVGPAFITGYLFMAAGVCHAKKYPGMPGIVVLLHFPAIMGAFRYWMAAKSVSSRQFHKALGVCCVFCGLLVFATWLAWIFTSDMQWGEGTKGKLQKSMYDAGIHGRYDLGRENGNWTDCRQMRTRVEDKGSATQLETKMQWHCQDLELTAFLIWVSPMVLGILLLVLSFFCWIRIKMMASGAEMVLKMVMFFVCLLGVSMWVGASIAGAALGMTSLLFAAVFAASMVVACWLVLSQDLGAVLVRCQKTTIFQTAAPFLSSDWFSSLLFCFCNILIFMFLALELFTRQMERVCNVEGKHKYITSRGWFLAKTISARHWASNLEKAFCWCMIYMISFLCSKITPVFLGWLDLRLEDVSERAGSAGFWIICIAFYLVGLIMFLLPPVPGVPVYFAAGVIVVACAGKSTEWLNFYTAILFASGLCLALKLNAVAMQQKLIGEGFGKSLYVQQMVGVHTLSVRAIKQILQRPGLSLEKVCILCGGPDWPTSVMTGILRCKLLQMLLGTLPCFFLILPAVLAGASITTAAPAVLRRLSALMIMAVGITQGGVLISALMFIAREVERNHAELSLPLPEHAELLKKAALVQTENQRYKQLTFWHICHFWQKFWLIGAVAVELLVCGLCAVVGSSCFNYFEIGSRIEAPIANGGLDNNALNLLKPGGYFVMIGFVVGIGMFVVYKVETSRVLATLRK